MENIKNSVALLGRVIGYKFEILDLNKLEVNVSINKKLGLYDAHYLVSKSSRGDLHLTCCGKIGTVDVDEDIQDITITIHHLDAMDMVLLEIVYVSFPKINTNGLPTLVSSPLSKLKFQGLFPLRVTIGSSVSPWVL